MNTPGRSPRRGRPNSRPQPRVTAKNDPNLGRRRPVAHAICAVTLDVGGTLIEVWPSVGHVYAEVAARHGLGGLSPGLLDRRFAAAWRAAKHFGHSRSDWAALVDATFRGLAARPPSQTFFPALFERFAAADAWHVFDDVVPTLNMLAARGYRLGIISNWDERLRPLLEELELAEYFEVIVISREVRCAKPAAGVFERAVRHFGLPPGAVLHVGDSRSLDVRGARAAGLSALWLNRAAHAARPGQIGSLRQLCDRLS